jgi:hypothetical protein
MRSVIVGLLLAACLVQSAWAEIGRVKRTQGEAVVERGGAAMTPKPGMTLETGDVLVTGADGRISVTFVDNTRMSAGPDSRVVLDRFEFDATTHEGDFVTRLDRGALAVVSGQIAKQTPDAMKVRTPTSLLGVRGTRFVVRVQ